MKMIRLNLAILMAFILAFSLAGCDSILENILPPPPTATPFPTATPTETPLPSETPTATFTPLPSPTDTIPPPPSPTLGMVGDPTGTTAPTQSVGFIKPVPSAKFRGEFDGGVIVFTTSLEGDRVGGLRLNFLCAGKDVTLNLSRASMKIENSSFSYSDENIWVGGQFTGTTSAKGTLLYELKVDGKTCSYSYTVWNASVK